MHVLGGLVGWLGWGLEGHGLRLGIQGRWTRRAVRLGGLMEVGNVHISVTPLHVKLLCGCKVLLCL